MKKREETVFFLFLSLKSDTVNFGFFNLFLDIRIRDPDSEYGSRPKLNADPTGSGTLHLGNGSGSRKEREDKKLHGSGSATLL
jgi:hypothetical protein